MMKKIGIISTFTVFCIVAGISIYGLYRAFNITLNNGGNEDKVTYSTRGDEKEGGNTSMEELNLKSENTINMLVMGDSLARGAGDENSKGFAGTLADMLEQSSKKDVILTNIGIDGIQSEQLLEQVPRVDEIRTSDIILISIGGNNLNRLRDPQGYIDENTFSQAQSRYLDNVRDILSNIRNKNEDALIVFLGLYNPYEGIITREQNELLHTWNYNTQILIESDPKSIYIQTYDLFKFNLGNYLSADRFHPNSAGYTAISQRMLEAIKTLF